MTTQPAELLCDIFQFLYRNEVEKSQLVSRKWNDVISTYQSLMPLRELHLSTMRKRKKHKNEIIIDCVTKLPGKQKIRTVNIFDKEDFKRELKNCVLVQLDINNVVGDEFDCSIKKWDMQMWEDMVKACGQKIKVKEVSLMQR
jgi:hypothetical protein